jgi:hypothetical protein
MPDITVHRHGDRWSVLEAGAESPVKEFPTREAAELAARDMAGGGSVEVIEEDPSGLDEVQDSGAGEPVDTGVDPAKVSARERARSTQTGL